MPLRPGIYDVKMEAQMQILDLQPPKSRLILKEPAVSGDATRAPLLMAIRLPDHGEAVASQNRGDLTGAETRGSPVTQP